MKNRPGLAHGQASVFALRATPDRQLDRATFRGYNITQPPVVEKCLIMTKNRRRIDITKLQKASLFFFRLAWIGGIVGFCLVLAIPVILGVLGAFYPEATEVKILIPCFSILAFYFFFNMSMKSLIDCIIEFIGVHRKKLTKRKGLEQAFVYLIYTLCFWWGIFWVVKELVNYLQN